MTRMQPLVSIIVLTYNSGKYVTATLDSIRDQVYPAIELVVSDDCSSDDTVTICNNWIATNKSRFTEARVITTDTNTGIPGNCNRGIINSKGEWIKLIAGDDLLTAPSIQIYIDELNKPGGEAIMVFHGRVTEFTDEQPDIEIELPGKAPRDQYFNRENTTAEEQNRILLRFCPVMAATVMLKRTLFDKYGYFDERFRFWEDRPMWFKLTANGVKMHFVDTTIARYRRHAESVQMNRPDTMFSRTMISKDEGYRKLFVSHLPLYERILHLYLISVRNFFYTRFGNKKNKVINLIYKVLTIIPEELTKYIRSYYAP